jgi:inorganic pyrophosphatase
MINETKKYIGTNVSVKIDRALGSAHPKYGWTYPVNYGYIPETKGADGEEIDAYVLLVEAPVQTFEGKCIAIIHRLDDDDDKLIVIPSDKGDLSDDEIRRLTDFQEKFFKSEIVRA